MEKGWAESLIDIHLEIKERGMKRISIALIAHTVLIPPPSPSPPPPKKKKKIALIAHHPFPAPLGCAVSTSRCM